MIDSFHEEHFEGFVKITIILTDEALNMLNTLMTEELIMNDSPLTTASDDVKDVTPNKLLLLWTNASYPLGTFSKHELSARRCWRQIHYLANVDFRISTNITNLTEMAIVTCLV